MVFLFPSKIKVLPIPFPYFCLVTIFACWIFNLHLLKERKRKRKRFPLFTMLTVLQILSLRLILIFQHGSTMWWILMERIVPYLWLGQGICQMFLGLIWCVLECSVLCPFSWMDFNLVELCFKLMWILWKKVCRWLEACGHWLVLSPPNMWSMILTGYAMLFSEYLWLEPCLIVTLTFDFADFLGTLNGNHWQYQKNFGEKNQEPRTWKSLVPEGGSSRGRSRRSSCKRTWSPNDVWVVFLFSYKRKGSVP